MNCYLVQEGNHVGTSIGAFFYDEIAGFQYEEGYVYTLKVRVVYVENPPADGSSGSYALVEIVSKEKV